MKRVEACKRRKTGEGGSEDKRRSFSKIRFLGVRAKTEEKKNKAKEKQGEGKLKIGKEVFPRFRFWEARAVGFWRKIIVS